jgi:hypothetical protein
VQWPTSWQHIQVLRHCRTPGWVPVVKDTARVAVAEKVAVITSEKLG